MGWEHSLQLALVVLLGATLVAAGIEDARIREIANAKTLGIALAAPLWWWANGLSPWPDMAVQLALGAATLTLFLGAFARGWMGGGDVKLIAALALWLPAGVFLSMLMLMSIVGGVVTVAMMIDRRIARRTGTLEVPYGVAIVIAALVALPRTEF